MITYIIQEQFINHENQRKLLEILLNELGNNQEGLEIDFSIVTHMDSIGVSMLIILYREATKHHKKMRLIHVNEKLMEILRITHLHTLFEIYEKEN